MLTGLKVSSLACKCIFYRQEHNAKGGGHEIEKPWNAKMTFANGENSSIRCIKWVICRVIIFTLWVKVIKMSKTAHFVYFFAYDSKILVTVWAKYLILFFYRPGYNTNRGFHGIEFWISWNAKIKCTNGYSSKSIN